MTPPQRDSSLKRPASKVPGQKQLTVTLAGHDMEVLNFIQKKLDLTRADSMRYCIRMTKRFMDARAQGR